MRFTFRLTEIQLKKGARRQLSDSPSVLDFARKFVGITNRAFALNFKREGARGNRPHWAPVSPEWAARKADTVGPQPTLVETGLLRAAVQNFRIVRATDTEAVISATLPTAGQQAKFKRRLLGAKGRQRDFSKPSYQNVYGQAHRRWTARTIRDFAFYTDADRLELQEARLELQVANINRRLKGGG